VNGLALLLGLVVGSGMVGAAWRSQAVSQRSSTRVDRAQALDDAAAVWRSTGGSLIISTWLHSLADGEMAGQRTGSSIPSPADQPAPPPWHDPDGTATSTPWLGEP